jgi:translation initiation factor 2 subunit 1
MKREQLAEKIVEQAAAKVGLKTEQLYTDIQKKTASSYVSIYSFFEDASKDDAILAKFGVDAKQAKALDEIIKLRIKPSEVEIMGKMKIMLYAPDGVDIVKDALKKALSTNSKQLAINYLGSGTYRFHVKAEEYKDAEKVLKAATDAASDIVLKNHGTVEFARDGEKTKKEK